MKTQILFMHGGRLLTAGTGRLPNRKRCHNVLQVSHAGLQRSLRARDYFRAGRGTDQLSTFY